MIRFGPIDVLLPDGALRDGAVLVDGDRIRACGRDVDVPNPAGARKVRLEKGILSPGFIDLQVNGGFGHDFSADPAAIEIVARQLPRFGVTAFLPTLITGPDRAVDEALAVVRAGKDAPGRARVLGLHAEGPFLAPARRGAHPAPMLRDARETPPAWIDDPLVRLVTLAPEIEGGFELIERLAARGTVVALGHSDAERACGALAIQRGARYGTHLFNAMSGLHHRRPGLAGALLDDDRVVCGLICDGVHLAASMVRLAWRIKGARGLNLVSDAVAAAGMPPGRYSLAGQDVIVDERSVHLPDGTLAGSRITLDEGLRQFVAETHAGLAEALPTVTSTPARVLGIDAGSIRVGGPADLVLLDAEGRPRMTLVGGIVVHGEGRENDHGTA